MSNYIVRPMNIYYYFPDGGSAPPCVVCGNPLPDEAYYVLQPFKTNAWVCSLKCADFYILQNI